MSFWSNPKGSLTKFIKDITGLTPPADNGAAAGTPYIEGYRDLDNGVDLTRKTQKIQEANWNQLYRYVFAVKMANADGSVNYDIKSGENELKDFGFNRSYVELQIPPSALSINTSFATSVVATNRGILEENNGSVFRSIALSGSTGVYPPKTNLGNRPVTSPGAKIFKSLMPGTANAIKNLTSRVGNTIASVTGVDPFKTKVTIDTKSTGYYQFWSLHNFFIAYAEAKKKRGAEKLRLVFISPKDNIGYVCTPMSFDLKRDKSDPLLYKYDIQLKCWDLATVSNFSQVDLSGLIPTPDDVGAIKAITNTLMQSRKTIQGARDVLSSVQSDISSIFNVYNQGLLVLKEIAGVAEDLADFGQVMRNNAQILLKGPENDFISALKRLEASSEVRRGKIEFNSADEVQSPFVSNEIRNSVEGAGGAISSGGATQTGEGFAPESSRQNQVAGSLSSALDNPDFLSNELSSFDMPQEVQEQLSDARDEASGTTSGQIRQMSLDLQETSDNFVRSVGGMDDTYAATYRLPPVEDTGREMTEEDIIIAAALQESRSAFTSTLATGQIFQERDFDPFATANSSLEQDDQMDTPISSFPVFFQRGSSLERLASQYLGDANRAREIAILNNLRAPYIDEVGFELDIFNANERQFVVNDVSSLVINQRINIKGNLVATTQRIILNIEDIGGGQFRVTVDGPTNLSIYAPGTSPKLESRLPGTIGIGDVILIPSESAANEDLAKRPSPLFNRLSHAEKVFKIDMALTDDGGDIAVASDGDVKRSSGYENAIQAIVLVTETERGELEQHRDYGVGVPIGSRNSDITLDELNGLVKEGIQADPRFPQADVISSVEGSVVRISIDAQGAGATGNIPVEFEVGKV